MATAPDPILSADPPADPSAPPAADPSAPPAADPSAPPAADPSAPNAGDPPADPPASPAANDDWRTDMAGEDADLLKYLGRYHSRDAALKAWKKQNDEIKAGKYLKPLPENATEAELKEFRAARGVPETAEGYVDKLPDGLVIGPDDKPYVDKFLSQMHAANADKPAVHAALAAYYDAINEQTQARADDIAAAKDEATEALREEWGGDFKRNVNVTNAFLGSLPGDVAGAIQGGMDADGRPLMNNAAVIKWLAGLALDANPIATVVPGAGSNQASAIADEIAEIDRIMRTDRDRYNKDAKMQARYRELIAAREKLPKD